MKIVIIGAVAAGTSAAAKARRNSEDAEIVIFEKDSHISYSGCGLPYYIGGKVPSIHELVPRDPAFFKKKYNVDIFIRHEVLHINAEKKELKIKNLDTGEVFFTSYDKLVISTGASAFKPSITGAEQDHVFYLRNVKDAVAIKQFIEKRKPATAVIAGTGLIGFEMLESFVECGIKTVMVEMADKVTPNLDKDVATYFSSLLAEKGIEILLSTKLEKIFSDRVVLSDGHELPADLVLLATGVRPNVELAKNCGIQLGVTKAIAVDERMQTSVADIYACGDCIETFSAITQKPVYRPLGSTANKTGRIAGDIITGGRLSYQGNLSTGIFKVFDLTVASTGLSETEALAEKYDIQVCHNIKPNKPEYLGGKEMLIKAIADKKTNRLLGVQIIGYEGVDKRIDVFAALISCHATVDMLFHLDLAYAPPFSTTKDPVHYTGMILDNAMHRGRELLGGSEADMQNTDLQILDVRSPSDYEKKGSLPRAKNVPLEELRKNIPSLDKAKPVLTYCNKGVSGNAAQNVLINSGFKKVYNLSGGHKFYKATNNKGDK